jgi:hypothetical protein
MVAQRTHGPLSNASGITIFSLEKKLVIIVGGFSPPCFVSPSWILKLTWSSYIY